MVYFFLLLAGSFVGTDFLYHSPVLSDFKGGCLSAGTLSALGNLCRLLESGNRRTKLSFSAAFFSLPAPSAYLCAPSSYSHATSAHVPPSSHSHATFRSRDPSYLLTCHFCNLYTMPLRYPFATNYGVRRFTSLGKSVAYRTFSNPKSFAVNRSKPSPSPPCGGIPYLCIIK